MQTKTSEASTDRPMVSIGLPAYNGGDFLRASIESLLAQTHRDFELVTVATLYWPRGTGK